MPRAPKVRLHRIDAAIDAVGPMGFSEPLIRQTVTNLLKVYGGDEGWPFIEEFSYKLLIDSILEEAAEDKNNSPKLLENAKSALMIEHGVSKFTKMHCNQVGPSRSQSPPLKKRALQVHNQINGSSSIAITGPRSSKGEISEAKHGKQMALTKISAKFSSPQVKVCSHSKNGSTEVKSGQLLLPPLAKPQPAQRRKPCYGWLESDDDEELN